MRIATLAAMAIATLSAAPALAAAPLCDGRLSLDATRTGLRTNAGTLVEVDIRNTTAQRQDVTFALNGHRPGFRLTVHGVTIDASGRFYAAIGRQSTTFGSMPTVDELAALLRVTCAAR